MVRGAPYGALTAYLFIRYLQRPGLETCATVYIEATGCTCRCIVRLLANDHLFSTLLALCQQHREPHRTRGLFKVASASGSPEGDFGHDCICPTLHEMFCCAQYRTTIDQLLCVHFQRDTAAASDDEKNAPQWYVMRSCSGEYTSPFPARDPRISSNRVFHTSKF